MEVEKGTKMGFEETELRLGLPGNGGGAEGEMVRKRGFSETVDLKLKLSSKESGADPNHEKTSSLQSEKNLLATDPAKPPAK
jgi:auxin-responsive protein IAA